MIEKQSTTVPYSFPSPEGRSLRRLRANVEKVDKLADENYKQEIEWKIANDIKREGVGAGEDDSELLEQLFVFRSASALHAAKVLDQRLRLNGSYKEVFGQDNPSITHSVYQNPQAGYVLAHELGGITLSDIFQNGDQLVRENPSLVYGLMLRSIADSDDKDAYQFGGHALTPIVVMSHRRLKSVVKQGCFPPQIAATINELSGIYLKAWSQVFSTFYNPDSPDFDSVVKISREIMDNGHPNQVNTFLKQILGIDSLDEGRTAYHGMQELMHGGKGVTFYPEFVDIIEDSYDGLKGEEMYALLGIEKSTVSSSNPDALARIQQLKRQFLGLMKDSEGMIELSDGTYGELRLLSPKVVYEKAKSSTFVAIDASIEIPNAEAIPLCFTLGKGDICNWTFLRDDHQVPELFNMVVTAAHEALNAATMRCLRSSNGSKPIETATSPQGYYKDEVYHLRKEERRRDKNDRHQEDGVREPGSVIAQASKLFEVNFPENVAASLSHNVREMAELAIAKYRKGLPVIENITDTTGENRKLSRIRTGDVRVVLELKDGILEVIGAGDREYAYNGINKKIVIL